MFRFLPRLRRPTLVRTTLGTLTLSVGALALHAHSHPDPDQPPLTSLLRAYLVFSLCSLPSLVDASPRILSFLSAVPVLNNVSEAFLKVTFFDQFVGAESIDGCTPLLHKLRRSNQGVLIAYSVERASVDASQAALESILHSIDFAADCEHSLSTSTSSLNHNSTGTWVSAKLSTLLPDPNALRVLSDWIIRRDLPHTAQIPFPGAPDTQDLQRFLQSNDHVDTQHIQTLRTLYTNLRKICTHAHARGVRFMIDAEETWFQPAIDLFSVLLMQEFNSPNPTSRVPQPLVYTTLQAYLVRTPALLDFLIRHAKDNEYSLGVKLVRGAYIDAEVEAHALRSRPPPPDSDSRSRSRSISPDANPPTCTDKGLTDGVYDKCVRVLVAEVARDVKAPERKMEGKESTPPRIAVLFGTHNWKSCRLVLDEMVRFGLGEVVDSGSGSEKIILSEDVRQRMSIAQLYGMSDSLAAYLVDRTSQSAGSNSTLSPFVIRCVPYGPLRDVLPYLARRAVENRSVLGSGDRGEGQGGRAVEERKRMGRLIRERFWKF